MNKRTVSQRILIAGATLLALLLLVGSVGVIGLHHIETLTIDRLQNDAVPGAKIASEIAIKSLRAQVRVLMLQDAPSEAVRADDLNLLNQYLADLQKAETDYEGTIFQADDRANFDKLRSIEKEFNEKRTAYVDLVSAGKIQDAKAYHRTQFYPAYAAYRDQVALILKWNQDGIDKATDQIIHTSTLAVLTAGIVAAASIVIGISLGWFIVRGINSALTSMARMLSDASAQVAAAASQTSGSSQSLAEGASQQAASLEETSASLEELVSMTKRNADSAASAKDLSAQTRSAAESGTAEMQQMRTAMAAIKDSSNEIAKIIRTIDEIAFQTNILALNAAVEAARAGDAGAGFAVVAEEVRALAQRSAESAKDTATKIEIAIRNGDQGVVISNSVAATLGVIVDKARKVDELVAEISTASSEQSTGLTQINSAMSQMDQVTQANAASAEETAAASEELSAQSMALQEAVTDLKRLIGGVSDTQAAEPAEAHEPRPPQKHSLPPRPSGRQLTAIRTPSLRRAPSETPSEMDSFVN